MVFRFFAHGMSAWRCRCVAVNSAVPLTQLRMNIVLPVRGRALSLPNPQFSRVDAFSRAVGELSDAIAGGFRGLPCDLSLGVTVVEWLGESGTESAQGTRVFLKTAWRCPTCAGTFDAKRREEKIPIT